jgi:hypothetical protein
LFDLSDYPKTNPLHDPTNKKVIGKMKDESSSVPITEFIGLRSKLYSYLTDGDDHPHARCKGVKKSVVSKYIAHNDYKNTLFQRQSMRVKQNLIRSHKHQLFTITQEKIGLSHCDDKCHILDNNIETLTFGHYKTK